MSKTSAKQRIEQLVSWNGARKKPSITRDVKPTITHSHRLQPIFKNS
jgi:hypothetical protein